MRKLTMIAVFAGSLLLGGTAAAAAETPERPGQTAMNPKGDWGLRCAAVAPPQRPRCTMFQNLLREDRQRVFTIAIHYPEQSTRPVGVLTMPLGLYLPKGFEIQVDEGEVRQFPIETCTVDGCRTALLIGDQLLGEMKRGLKARIRFHSNDQKPIDLPISLIGFSKALGSIQPDA